MIRSIVQDKVKPTRLIFRSEVFAQVIESAEKYPINIWINEERHDKLSKVGQADITEDVLTGMKVLRLYCTAKQKDQLLKLCSMAKYDSATNKSIELLPAEVNNKIFDFVIERKRLNTIVEFLKKLR